MKSLTFLLVWGLALAACTPVQHDASAREWQLAECNRVIDSGDRERCIKRVDETYGTRASQRREPAKRPPGITSSSR